MKVFISLIEIKAIEDKFQPSVFLKIKPFVSPVLYFPLKKENSFPYIQQQKSDCYFPILVPGALLSWQQKHCAYKTSIQERERKRAKVEFFLRPKLLYHQRKAEN